ncbi:hypothetical protein [Aminobacter sp. MET-1]|uniref:hypothetical protein n=1 Tax=Aminobacter sp. MET-1 TaxID=2951085 RepID=UPI00226A3D00|nr:hypothetical protein [Aminobacter sp. MET-1]MCX8571155.1 hypothetical protein [Aminobacter sp. MET-1]MCX8573347.1 hypothetical protein [Aminobacter sp. MET-1]
MKSPSSNRSESKRRLPFFHELLEDEERRGGGGGGGSGPASRRSRPSRRPSAAPTTPFSRATGNNAVVVKILSYGAGAKSARNVLEYQAKEERALDQDGREVTSIQDALEQWQRDFTERQGSKDVVLLNYELPTTDRETVTKALDDLARDGIIQDDDTKRTYAYSIGPGVKGQTRLSLAIVLAHEKSDRADRGTDNQASPTIDTIRALDLRISSRLKGQGIEPVSRYPAKFASGQKGLTATLHAMQRQDNEVTLSTHSHLQQRENKTPIYKNGDQRRSITTANHKELTTEGRTVGVLLQSRQPRDFMHLLLSGPANVDRAKFVEAAGEFLRTQFHGHRYAYAVHNRNEMDKHPHVHAIVSLKGPGKTRLNPNIRDFTEWRERFADKARARGLAIDHQRRLERAGPPPVKRWEWEMFRRLGAYSPPNVMTKVMSKIRDKPTAPKLPAGLDRFNMTKNSLNRVLDMLDTIAKDRTQPSTARELTRDLAVGLRREYQRLETAVSQGRDPALEKGDTHMLRNSPITASQAKTAKDAVAATAATFAKAITNPADRALFESATQIIGKVVNLQLDARAAKGKERDNDKATNATSTKSAAGRDPVLEKGEIDRTSSNRTVDESRIAQANQGRAADDRSERGRDKGKEREQQKQTDRELPTRVVLTPPKDRDRGDRSR